MEQALIRSPFVMFGTSVVTGGLLTLCFPSIGWFLPPLLIAIFAYSVFASFFTTRYTAYHWGMNWLLVLNFFTFVAVMTETALDPWVPQRVSVLAVCAYIALLITVYQFRYHKERRINWKDFRRSLSNRALMVENGRVRRIVRSRSAGAKRRSGTAANVGGALGVGALGLVGALFGANGKEILLLICVAGFMMAPFFLLRYFVTYGIGIHEVRKVERERGVRFDFDNVTALQEARRGMFFARLLNPRLRHQG